jgi:hypothetical protein
MERMQNGGTGPAKSDNAFMSVVEEKNSDRVGFQQLIFTLYDSLNTYILGGVVGYPNPAFSAPPPNRRPLL